MPGHIVIVGSINMDLVVRAPRHPEPGETILGSSFQTFPGGKGANQAVAAARAGGSVKMIGRVGEDTFGDVLLANLQKDGVDTTYVRRTPDVSSGIAQITVSDSGQNNIVVVQGANARLTPADLHDSEAAFQGASVVVAQLEIPLETVAQAARMARKYGAHMVLNPAPARSLPNDLLAQVDYLIPNEHELAMLTGMEAPSIAASVLKSMGVLSLIVTLGSRGVKVLAGGHTQHILPYSVNVVDTTAAGDGFVGAFAVALTEGKRVLDAAAFGNAAGALSVMTAGAQPSLPTRAALDTFIERHPTRYEEED